VEIMNKYESVIIINPSLEEQGMKDVITKFTDLISKDGKVENVEEVGRKKLAYEIKKNTEGYYVVITFEANPEFITELERIYRITDDIMKFITIRKED
jgi:small subunit ribosomal protein S6